LLPDEVGRDIWGQGRVPDGHDDAVVNGDPVPGVPVRWAKAKNNMDALS